MHRRAQPQIEAIRENPHHHVLDTQHSMSASCISTERREKRVQRGMEGFREYSGEEFNQLSLLIQNP